jgi:hypothetical protein
MRGARVRMDLHISTKLSIPPTRSNLVPRPHLYRQLNRLIHHKLLLVSAPAGFGKTTLLSAWCGQSVWPVAWVSLDAADNDPMRFWSYVTAALATFDANIDRHILPLIRAPRPIPVDDLCRGGYPSPRRRVARRLLRKGPYSAPGAAHREAAGAVSPGVSGFRLRGPGGQHPGYCRHAGRADGPGADFRRAWCGGQRCARG